MSFRSTPSPDEAFACGSASITNTFFSSVANDAAKFMVVVVFPTPPFWLAKAIIFPILISLSDCEVTNNWRNSVSHSCNILQNC